RMNSKAAVVSMVMGVASFIILGELIRGEILIVPEGVDELMIALVISVISLIITAAFSKPNNYELQYFSEMKNTRMAKITLDEYLKKPNGVAIIKKQYKQIITT